MVSGHVWAKLIKPTEPVGFVRLNSRDFDSEQFRMGGADEIISRVLHFGMGESPSNSPNVLYEFPIISEMQPMSLTIVHFDDMVESGAPFARKFTKDDPVLNKIDKFLLRRLDGLITPGGWCVGNPKYVVGHDPCLVYGNTNVIKPSVNLERLESLIVKLLDPKTFRSKQCK
ncbi:hypothetical protein ACFE04_003115 [Oxalis oulophora]